MEFTVLGNGWPDSKWIVSSVWVYLLMGSMDLMLRLTLLCCISLDAKGAKA